MATAIKSKIDELSLFLTETVEATPQEEKPELLRAVRQHLAGIEPDDLTLQIRDELALVETEPDKATHHTLAAGRLLNSKYTSMGHGKRYGRPGKAEWSAYLKSNFGLSDTEAARMMNAAREWPASDRTCDYIELEAAYILSGPSVPVHILDAAQDLVHEQKRVTVEIARKLLKLPRPANK